MQLPIVVGRIERRILINYRIDPEVAAALLPPPFRPQLVNDFAIAGICLIRLSQLRPRFVPAWLGFGSENAALRFAVEWEEGSRLRHGVYVPRRETASRFNVLAGGRVFPGVHHRATFEVAETETDWGVRFESTDGDSSAAIRARLAESWPPDSVFRDRYEASAFFQLGGQGFSPSRCGGCLEGLELRTERWELEPLAVEVATSSYFEDKDRFPPGTAAFDSAFLMRDIPHLWRQIPAPGVRERALQTA